MSLVVGARMVRQDDGMRGVVEMVAVTVDGKHQEPRVVYIDRGERRIAPKKERWEPEAPPPRKLRDEEISRVASAADRMLEALEQNKPVHWWEMKPQVRTYDTGLYWVIVDYLSKRA